jgi:hypothetical protein
MKYDVIRSYWPAPIYDTDTALLSLDFTAGTLPTAVTFTRADSTARATYIDASGYVKTVASAGDARFDYTGGVAKGLLIEASAINRMTQSNTFTDTGAWVAKTNLNTTSWTGFTAPDQSTNAVRLVPNTTNGAHRIEHADVSGLTDSTQYTVSIWCKPDGYPRLGITTTYSNARRNFAPASNSSTGYGAASTGSIVAFPSGWYRCSMTFTTGAANTPFAVFLSVHNTDQDPVSSWAGNNTDGLQIWGCQVELGAQASSYIPTTTAALTRLADDAVIRSTAWTSLYAQPGAMVVEFYRGAYGAGDRSVLATDTTAARHWDLLHANGSATAQIAFSSGSAVTQTGLVSGLNKVALAWNAPTPTASFDLCVNGATPTFGGSNVGTTLSTWLTLGSQSTTGVSGSGTWDNYLNNSIKSVKYYTGLTYAEMQAKTT